MSCCAGFGDLEDRVASQEAKGSRNSGVKLFVWSARELHEAVVTRSLEQPEIFGDSSRARQEGER